MTINYSNGKKYTPLTTTPKKLTSLKKMSHSKRGMSLEDDLNDSNRYYLAHNIAVVHKKPTPIKIVKVKYPSRSQALITEAYFSQASTTDYNGVFKGKYIDFEAKETTSSTAFPLKNIHEHQLKHMLQVHEQSGIAFVIIRFTNLSSTYLLDIKQLHYYWQRMLNDGRKSIALKEIEATGHPIILGYHPRVDYIQVIKNVYHL
ncbi:MULTISPECIES: Holliday junction resolvase RecU [Brochothrix]|uniref:Holliday junction resolvase RecU n=1 Tax=Brochothrix thermosphacta TaxID=2756 RepID=A0A1D2LIN6_BROTH|nr:MULTISPECIES: Holliday junction resolvase RecU [Brochothrix]ANZ94349.1 Holliday junction resolvase RecU [Brochothrix thermosphacta]ANZ97353.1 Holliday junction resolvase RecU [Brochothrix thermosphacta]ATF26786.1 Holliday junction resolvase RecU [Brochothrix thermosphacta]ATH86143.1 Holliday junction resolvase RecU [Brochothrix thermosphacta]MBR5526301.1 Holliday junction resolvase RecU [Brochothrix sp.]